MWILREHRETFLSLKLIQIIFTIIILTIEIVQYAVHANLKPESPDYPAVNQFINDFGAVKIWNSFVFSLTFIALGVYIYNFKKFWNNGPYFCFDLSFVAFWITSAIVNLNPAYGQHQTCSSATTTSLTTICNTWITSVVFCWLNMLTFIISTFISWRVKEAKRKGIYPSSKNAIKPDIKKRMSQRQSVLLKQGLENPDKPQPVMLEPGYKHLMLVQLANS